MRRRDFIAVAAFAAFPAAAAQIRTVAVLMPSPETDAELKARVGRSARRCAGSAGATRRCAERGSRHDLRLKPHVDEWAHLRLREIARPDHMSAAALFLA